MKNWVWGYGYYLNYLANFGVEDINYDPSKTWPASLFALESLACQREGTRRGEQTKPYSYDM